MHNVSKKKKKIYIYISIVSVTNGNYDAIDFLNYLTTINTNIVLNLSL
jgi:accessory colonization factor AcfC